MMRQGGCLCGAVRYQIKGKPISSGICHCRKTASAPTLPFVVLPPGALTFTHGRPVEFCSSPHVVRSFCGRCGSPLTYRTDEKPGRLNVKTCSLDGPEARFGDPVLSDLEQHLGAAHAALVTALCQRATQGKAAASFT